MKEEILSAAVSQLKAKVDAIMLDINIILTTPSHTEDFATKAAVKITELAVADTALRQATALLAQAMAHRLATTTAGVSRLRDAEPKEDESHKDEEE